ncbi:MAG: class I SAM-dependent methyltransferase [Herpetosiphonaceae bacterium]|nr:class I SAM-dependent methyltransferase [Herpetosiphonaceae bacterium]
MTTPKRPSRKLGVHTSWDPVARWYDGWVGAGGSYHHRTLAIPAVLDLLAPQPGEHILDLGAGQGVLAPFIARAGAHYIGVDASPYLINIARRRHDRDGIFLVGDARRLPNVAGLRPNTFDSVVLLLSIQDMDPLDPVCASIAWALAEGGRTVLLMTHPCFRIPRQSGWGWDDERKLQYRRIDRYFSPLPVPMKEYGGEHTGSTRSFHRPLQAYINGLADHHLLVDSMREILGSIPPEVRRRDRAVSTAHQEIPLFLALRATKITRT